MWCVIDAHKILTPPMLHRFMGELKDDVTLQSLARVVKERTQFDFVAVGWHDSTDINLDTWGKFTASFASQQQAVHFQLMWG